MTSLVLLEKRDPLAIVTLNRPERHNSLVPELLESFLSSLNEVSASPKIRVVLLFAEGPSFSTGGDLLGFVEHGENLAAYARGIVTLLNQVIMAMINLPQPIVSAVHGPVTGGSIGLVLASDIVLIAPEGTITPYYSEVGFSPDGGWTAILPDLIGTRRTAELLMLNHTIRPEQAVAWGIANRIVPGHQIRSDALSTAEGIARMKPGSVRYTKKLLGRDSDSISDHLDAECQYFVDQIVTEEASAGVIDFLAQMKARRQSQEGMG